MKSEKPLVSIIIPTRNSIRTIGTCLKSIKNQTYENIEIIIVDGSSVDGTREVAEKYNAIILTTPYEVERTVKKNIAAHKADGFYLYFIDSDFELTPRIVENCVKACDHYYDAIIIPEMVISSKGFWGKCRELEELMYHGDDNVESPRFFRKDVFYRAGGFDETLIFGEENDLNVKIRSLDFRIGRINNYLYHHEGSLTSLILRKFYYGRSAFRYIKKRKKLALLQFSPIRFGWIRHKRLLLSNPLYAMGMIFQKSVQYMATIFGLIVDLAENRGKHQRV